MTLRKRVRETVPDYAVSPPTRLLLDTQVWIWWQADDARLGPVAREGIVAATDVRFSAASAWEIAIKTALGKLKLPPRSDLLAELEYHGFQALPIEIGHALRVARLPGIHRDPFDRMLAAQAIVEGLTLMTADAVFGRYGVAVMSAAD